MEARPPQCYGWPFIQRQEPWLLASFAIEDMAMEENISIDEARNKLLDSDACKCLYDFDSKLWMEGSDYFLDFYRMIENKQHIS